MSTANNESKRERRTISPEQKVAIVKKHLIDGKSVSDRCDEHNHAHLHSSIGYITSADKLYGREGAIFAKRDRKLDAARQRRARNRQAARENSAA